MGKIYKPVRLEESQVNFVDKFIIGTDFTKRMESILEDFEGLLTLTKKELTLTFSKNEFMYFISIFDASIIKEFNIASNHKQFLISKIQEYILHNNIDENFNISTEELLQKVQGLSVFSSYTLIYQVLMYNKLYAENDINNIYFNSFFSPV